MKQNQGSHGNHRSRGNHGIHGSCKSHEVIAVGRGHGKSHENNEDTNPVQSDHVSFFSEINLQDTALHE
ncbi:9349_t:CDS:2, partial [Entrophospora sp. SA101]